MWRRYKGSGQQGFRAQRIDGASLVKIASNWETKRQVDAADRDRRTNWGGDRVDPLPQTNNCRPHRAPRPLLRGAGDNTQRFLSSAQFLDHVLCSSSLILACWAFRTWVRIAASAALGSCDAMALTMARCSSKAVSRRSAPLRPGGCNSSIAV